MSANCAARTGCRASTFAVINIATVNAAAESKVLLLIIFIAPLKIRFKRYDPNSLSRQSAQSRSRTQGAKRGAGKRGSSQSAFAQRLSVSLKT